MSDPIRFDHVIHPLIALPRDGRFRRAFAIAEGYDPGDVAAWSVTLTARYGPRPRAEWTSADVTVSGQIVSFSFAPDTPSDADADVLLSALQAEGACAWSLDALDVDGVTIWRVQGPVDFTDDAEAAEGSASLITPLSIRLSEDETPIALTLLTGIDGRDLEMQVGETHIQYRAVGAAEWIDLIALADFVGETGPQGEPGAPGEQGPQGESGQAGATGTRGSKWYQGSGAPATNLDGLLAGDFYFRTSDFSVHEYSGSAWSQIATITATIANGSVTNAQLADMEAGTFKMRTAGSGPGAPINGTGTQARAAMGLATTDAPTFGGVTVGGSAGDIRFGSGSGGYRFFWHPGNFWYLVRADDTPILAANFDRFIVGNSTLNLGNSQDNGISRTAAGEIEINNGTVGIRRNLTAQDLTATRYLRPASYTVAAANALVSPPDGALILVSNEAGGATVAQRARGAWRRIYDDAAIS